VIFNGWHAALWLFRPPFRHKSRAMLAHATRRCSFILST
jgi:hypothetical protein